MKILVADIGGTNARFAIAEKAGGNVEVTHVEKFLAQDFENPRDAAVAYLEAVRVKPDAACFAVAAPVQSETIKFTNSHWVLNVADIRSALSNSPFKVVNDFYALAAGVDHLPKEDLQLVRPGEGFAGRPRLVIGPGTGLGQALLVPSSDHDVIIPTEGGHAGFAPTTELEIEVLRFIAREHDRVTVERLLSGRGLVNLHRALCVIHDVPRVSLQASEITAAALSGELPVALEAVEMFCELLGDVAGNAVLGTGAQNGVFLGGGILPKLGDFFLKSRFVERFEKREPMAHYVALVPVRLIISDTAALYGAAAALDHTE